MLLSDWLLPRDPRLSLAHPNASQSLFEIYRGLFGFAKVRRALDGINGEVVTFKKNPLLQ